MYEYFQDYCRDSGISFDQLLSLGRSNPGDAQESFSMAIAAFKTSAYRNAVSRLHRHVSQQMWQSLWPKLPVWKCRLPQSRTEYTCLRGSTGIWPAFTISRSAGLEGGSRRRFGLGSDFRNSFGGTMGSAPPTQAPVNLILSVKGQRPTPRSVTLPPSEIKRLQEVLDPEALTIGFARRFATYKRATLVFATWLA